MMEINGQEDSHGVGERVIWVDSEVHLLPPEWCAPDYWPPPGESIMRRVIYDHSGREEALSQASIDGLLAEMEVAHMDRAVIMGFPWRDPSMCWDNNAYISEAVQGYPRRFIGLGVLPPPDRKCPGDAVKRVADEYGLRGIKVIPSWQGYRLDHKVFEPALEELTARGLVLVPHVDHLFIPPDEADAAYSLYEVGRRYPELRILAPHLGGLLCLYALHPPVRPTLENILFVTSVPTTMEMIMFALKAVGPEQLAFGTDFPFNPSHDQETVRLAFESLPLSEKDRAQIAGQNVLQFFGGIP